MEKIGIKKFIEYSKTFPVLDVRSPGEFIHAHIPNAYNLPLFSDEERKIVGTAYKQESREKAIKLGLDFFGVKMRKMVEVAEEIIIKHDIGNTTNKSILVHCWRGGMRSAAVAWLLNLYGFKVYTLAGGYKSFRNWVLEQFENKYVLNVIGGYTGSGKTFILHELEKKKETIIDLEGIAKHKGSAFGGFEQIQPSQEMFENELAVKLQENNNNLHPDKSIWVEDESQRIGAINIPASFWKTMRKSPVYFIDIPFENRLQHIVAEYGNIKREELINAIMRIQKRLGNLETKNAINFLLEKDTISSFSILLRYYDKQYEKGLHNRENIIELLQKISCINVDAKINTKLLLNSILYKQEENNGRL